MHINEIIDWVDGAFGAPRPAVDAADVAAFERICNQDGYQRFLQDQVNRQIIRDYLANAVLLGVISEGGLPAFAIQLASEEGRSSLALHMLMCSVDEAVDLLPVTGQVEALTPLKPKRGDRPHIKLVPS